MPAVWSNLRFLVVGLGIILTSSLPQDPQQSCKGAESDEDCPLSGSALLQNRMQRPPGLKLVEQDPPCGDADAVLINIAGSELTANLPDDELMRFSGVATFGGASVDLEVTVGEGYECNHCSNNGKRGGNGDGLFGQLNSGIHELPVTFTFKNQETGEPVVLPRFHMTFLDFDGGVDREVLTVPAGTFDGWYVTPDTSLVVEEDGDLQAKSTRNGGLGDNPTDPNNLSDLQKNSAIQIAFSDKSSFTVTYTVNQRLGRTMLFGGFMEMGGCAPPGGGGGGGAPPVDPCGQLVQFDIDGSELVVNNAESGDHSETPLLTFAGVGTVDGSSIDLEVTTRAVDGEEYSCNHCSNNGKSHQLGAINFGGSAQTFIFTFKNHETGEPVVLPSFYMSFMDFDGGVNRENVDVPDYDTYYTMPNTELVIEEEDGVVHAHSTTNGALSDNPTDLNQLTDQQLARTLVVGFISKSSVELTYRLGPPTNGRTFLFAGCVDGFADACPCAPSL